MLYFGDNLRVMESHIPTGSVALVYLDPPFNSKAQYNLLYETRGNQRENAQQTVFRDSWSWEDQADDCYDRVLSHGGRIAEILEALIRAWGRTDTMAYLAMMAARLIEVHRVLKPDGSLYLHCDPTASHYIKAILDAIFGPQNFQNEVIWKRTSAHSSAKRWGPVHDTILFYSKGDTFTWNQQFLPHSQRYLDTFFDQEDSDGTTWKRADLTGAGIRHGETGTSWRGIDVTAKGRHWQYPPSVLDKMDAEGRIHWPHKVGGMPRLKQYASDLKGVPIQDVITDIRPLHNLSEERLGYPTQKPVTLLERIISASSIPGDVVLDPFCGCGTTVEAAQNLSREWIGIDVSYYAVRLIERRMKAKFGRGFGIRVEGIPADYASANGLAEADKHGFQQWAVGELGCQLWNNGTKGKDGGIDGEMWFYNPPHNAGRILVQVKGGRKVGVSEFREFKDVCAREKANMGVFFCRAEPTSDMRTEAVSLGTFSIGGKTFRKMQLVSLAMWFSGQRPELPIPIRPTVVTDNATKAAARRVRRPDPKQPSFTFVLEGLPTKPSRNQVLNPAILPDDSLRDAGTAA